MAFYLLCLPLWLGGLLSSSIYPLDAPRVDGDVRTLDERKMADFPAVFNGAMCSCAAGGSMRECMLRF